VMAAPTGFSRKTEPESHGIHNLYYGGWRDGSNNDNRSSSRSSSYKPWWY